MTLFLSSFRLIESETPGGRNDTCVETAKWVILIRRPSFHRLSSFASESQSHCKLRSGPNPLTSKRNRPLIGCSWQANHLALNLGVNLYTCPTYSAKVCFIVATVAGNITTSVNTGRQAGPMSGVLLLDVYDPIL